MLNIFAAPTSSGYLVVHFRKEFFHHQGMTLGRMDGRSLMADFDTVSEEPENDYWLMEDLYMSARNIIEDFSDVNSATKRPETTISWQKEPFKHGIGSTIYPLLPAYPAVNSRIVIFFRKTPGWSPTYQQLCVPTAICKCFKYMDLATPYA